MSSGRPLRPSGTWVPNSATPSGPRAIDGIERLRRRDHSRCDRVDRDAVGAELEREAPHHALDARLAGRVVRVLGPADRRSGDRAGGEQPASAARPEVRERLAEAAEDTGQVDVEERAPALVVELPARHEPGDRGVRKHDVDAAEALVRRGQQLPDLLVLRTSTGTVSALPPAAVIASATGSTSCGSPGNQPMTTFAPARAEAWRWQAPMPGRRARDDCGLPHRDGTWRDSRPALATVAR